MNRMLIQSLQIVRLKMDLIKPKKRIIETVPIEDDLIVENLFIGNPQHPNEIGEPLENLVEVELLESDQSMEIEE